MMHHSAQVADPEWNIRYCFDPALLCFTWQSFVLRYADTKMQNLTAHIPE